MPHILLPILALVGLRPVVSVFDPPARLPIAPPEPPSPEQDEINRMFEALLSA